MFDVQSLSGEIERACHAIGNQDQAINLRRFFKCGEGEYGFGDKFLGLKVPQTRGIIKAHKNSVNLIDVEQLLASEWHEIRLAGLFLLLEIYKRSDCNGKKDVVKFYVNHLDSCNNWDLVDLSAPGILGMQAVVDDEALSILKSLSNDSRLWHRRIGIVATLSLIRKGRLEEIYEIAENQFDYQHDLIRKATGWMLREAGKKDEARLKKFLADKEPEMPRTTFRYATEIIKRKEKGTF